MSATRLILGTAQIGSPYGVAQRSGAPDAAECDAILRSALELGVRGLDTAPDYGVAEERIGTFLADAPGSERLEVFTKLPALPQRLGPSELEATVCAVLDGSRRRLGRETIDGYLIHSARDLLAYGDALVDVLARCRDAGRVSWLGVSVYDPFEAEAALGFGELGALQLPFNLFDRRMHEAGWIDLASRRGWRVFARSALLQGLLVLDPTELPMRLRAAEPWLVRLSDFAKREGLTRHALALSHAVSRSGADAIVLGVDSAEQLRACVAALDAPLDVPVHQEIEAAFANVPPEIFDPRRWTAP